MKSMIGSIKNHNSVITGKVDEKRPFEITYERIMKSAKRVNEVYVDLQKEKVVFPKNGFFVIVDRLNLEENKNYNKISKTDILQPAIGMERTEQEKNTWFGFGGKWIPPSEMKEFLGTNGNIAVNVNLTN